MSDLDLLHINETCASCGSKFNAKGRKDYIDHAHQRWGRRHEACGTAATVRKMSRFGWFA